MERIGADSRVKTQKKERKTPPQSTGHSHRWNHSTRSPKPKPTANPPRSTPPHQKATPPHAECSAAAGGLRRSLSSSPAASRPPWALVQLTNVDKSGAPAPGATLHLDAPPFVTDLTVPAHFIHPRPLPDPATGVYGSVPGHVAATSSHGLLLLRFWESRFRFDAAATGDSLLSAIRDMSFFAGMDVNPEVTRFVLNPLSGELYRLPDLDGTKRTSMYQHLGLLTHSHSQAGRGPPDSYAVAEMFTIGRGEDEEGSFLLRRFLSETGKWEKMVGLPSPLPAAAGRRMHIDSAVVPFGDRLWWIDESWGAISVDPLSERPELRFVELPRGSVLPDLDGVVFMRKLRRYRRMGESEGKMRYVEVSKEKPYVVSSFSLDDGGSSWSLDNEVAFATIWDDEPLKEMPAIGAIDPLNSHVVYLVCGNQLLGVDMDKEKITGSSRLAMPSVPILPCVLPTWLESSQIPSAGISKLSDQTLFWRRMYDGSFLTSHLGGCCQTHVYNLLNHTLGKI